jgi:hypothetical protein
LRSTDSQRDRKERENRKKRPPSPVNFNPLTRLGRAGYCVMPLASRGPPEFLERNRASCTAFARACVLCCCDPPVAPYLGFSGNRRSVILFGKFAGKRSITCHGATRCKHVFEFLATRPCPLLLPCARAALRGMHKMRYNYAHTPKFIPKSILFYETHRSKRFCPATNVKL